MENGLSCLRSLVMVRCNRNVIFMWCHLSNRYHVSSNFNELEAKMDSNEYFGLATPKLHPLPLACSQGGCVCGVPWSSKRTSFQKCNQNLLLVFDHACIDNASRLFPSMARQTLLHISNHMLCTFSSISREGWGIIITYIWQLSIISDKDYLFCKELEVLFFRAWLMQLWNWWLNDCESATKTTTTS